jgi:phosphatidylglycerophosphate synthase
MLALVSAQDEALALVAGLPVAVRNVIAAHMAGIGRSGNGRIIVLTARDSLAGQTIAAALAKTTVNVEPLWIAAEAADAFAEWNEDELAVFAGPGVLVTAPEFFTAIVEPAPFASPVAIAAGRDAVALVGPLRDVLRLRNTPALDDSEIAAADMGADKLHQVLSDKEARQAQKYLFSRAGKASDGVISRYFNRPISQRISALLAPTPLRPIHLTAVTAMSALASFAALMTGTASGLVVGCVLFQVTSVIDGIDGEIARVKFMSTSRGAAIDTAVDMAGNILFFIGLTYGLYSLYGSPYEFLGGFIVLTTALSISLLLLLPQRGSGGGSLDGFGMAVRARITGRILPKVFEFFGNVLRRDFFAFAAAVTALSGQAFMLPWGIAIGTAVWLGAILANTRLLKNAVPQDITPPHLREPF